MNKVLSFLLALFFVPLFSAVADVSCPSGYTTVVEDVVYVSSDNTCPSGHTKLDGEYGADTILNCTTAKNESICTYFAEQCPAGKYFNGTSYQTCLAGSYCDGSGVATPGMSGCSQTCPSNSSSQPGATSTADCICNDGYYMNNGVCETCPAGHACSGGEKTRCENGTYAGTGQSTCTTCPTPRNTIGAAIVDPEANQDLNENGVFESKNECGVLYMFVEESVSNESFVTDNEYYQGNKYNPNSEANKRGNAYVYCSYNASTDEYDLNCVGYPLGCAGGYYSSGYNSDTHTEFLEDNIPVYRTDTLSEFVNVYCEPVGANYWSPAVIDSGSDTGPYDSFMRYSCPANSSTNGSTTATSCTCNDGYTLTGTIGGNVQTTIDACRPIPEFTITTTDMPADTLFEFMISAAGDYTINWGDGNIEFISIPTPAVTMISHTYTESGVRTIGIAGDATSYNTDEDFKYAVISFTDEYYVSKMRGTAFNYIAKIEGSLGAIFSGSAQNMFAHTFGKCENLTEIPGDLFKGVSGAANDMFRGTFAGCTSLETIPMGLFSGVTGAADSMFENVFSGCTGLQSLPEDLFASVVYEDTSKDVTGLFAAAFIGCTGLTELPANLFSGIKVAGPQMFNATFANCSSLKTIYSGLFGNIAGSANSQYVLTFANCSSLSEIPEGLFASFSDDGENDNSAGVFYGTFGMCASLNKIPENLFENVTRATQYMFLSTFAGCEKLSNIPEKLFANIEGKPAEHSFANTFAGCTGLTGYVPATLFEKMDSTDYEAGPMTGIFEGTNYDTQCPVNNYQYKTGFEVDWLGKVACSPCPDGYITDGPGATDISQCYIPCEKQCIRQTCPDNALNCTHGTEVTTGKQYVGGTCNAASSICEMTVNCNNGYDKQDGEIVLVAQTPLIPVDYMDGGDTAASIDAGGNLSGNSDFGLTENNTWAAHFDYGTVYGRASCQPSVDAGAAYVINYNNLYDVGTGIKSIEDFETELAAISGTTKAKYMTDAIRGLQDGTITDADFGNAVFVVFGVEYNANYSTTDRGQYCYCQMTGYTPTNESKQSAAGNWVYVNDLITSGDCATNCANVCADSLWRNETPFSIGIRAAVFGSLRAENTAKCVAKIIDVPSGYYLPANTTEYIPCPANSYCPGVSGITLHETQNQGLKPCPDNYMSDKGATSETQCYTTCTKQCTPQTCPDNSINCVHGNDVTTGIQYVGGVCDAKESACNISFDCSTGYTKSGLAQWAINNIDLLIENETDLPMCGLDGFGSCDELKPGEWASYYTDGLPIKNATGVAVCNSVPGDDSSFDARINKDADFDLNTTGNYCWMKVQTVNDSFLPASWVYGWQYDSPEQCADDCGWSLNPDFQTVELAIIWGAQYDVCVANEYTVTYDCNGGAGNTTETVTYNSVFTPRTDVCEYDGYQFTGWTLNGATVSDSFVWNTTDNQTLVATWKQLSAECATGEYLPANTATCMPCKENNYCPGGKYDVSDTDTGINPCPENSSSQSGAAYCTCYDGYTVSGSVDGVTQTTTTACKFVPEFSITTVPMSAGQEFKFGLTAAGTFYIDCGTGGTPNGATTVSGNVGTIIRNSARNDGLYDVYSCRYDTAGSHTIRMSGNATAYTTHFTNSRYDEESMVTVGAYYTGAIYFNANKLIKEIHGSLGQIFSTLDNGAQPSFYLAFEEQSNMTGQIPAELFSGVHGEPIAGMFGSLFKDCSSLQGTIPKDLFKDIKGKPAPGVFSNTFAGCSSLQGPIPSELFVNIKGDPASHMFAWTFGDCTNLSGSIDRNLFSGISGSAAEGMFIGTFYNCSNLTGGIDQDLFKNIVGAPQPYMFAQTFFGCERLSGGLPENLFRGINGAPAEAMYVGTFAFCSSLDGNIPETLFGTIKGDAAPNMYYGVFMDDRNLDGEIPAGVFGDISGKPQYDSFGDAFNGCSSLTGSVPIDMFKNMDNTSYVSGPMYGMFNDTGLVTQCPENMYQYKTGFEVDWSGRVACTPCPNDGISPAGSTDITQCYIIKPCGQYTDITTTCYYNTASNDYTNCAECAVDSSCPYNQELVNGKCAPCNRDNAINYHETGNCMVSECEPGYQPYMQQCMPDKISCDAPNAEIAYQYWGIESRAYGPCIISKCVSGYNIEANACVPDVQPCELEHGTGTKTYNHDTGTWGKCIASECEPGYTTDSMLTDDVLDGQCGRCSNMFVDNDLAVSTYVSGCEIATCMYQGEKYILENNECRMICSELHDDTGDRYWNGKKCVQECKDGYSMW